MTIGACRMLNDLLLLMARRFVILMPLRKNAEESDCGLGVALLGFESHRFPKFPHSAEILESWGHVVERGLATFG